MLNPNSCLMTAKRTNPTDLMTSSRSPATFTELHGQSLPSLSVQTRSLCAGLLRPVCKRVFTKKLEQRFLQRLNMFIDVKSEFLLVICNKVSRNQKLVMFPEEK